MSYANNRFPHYSDLGNCWTPLWCVLSQREHSSHSHRGLLWWDYTTLAFSVGKGHDYFSVDSIYHSTGLLALACRAGRYCLLKARVKLRWIPIYWGARAVPTKPCPSELGQGHHGLSAALPQWPAGGSGARPSWLGAAGPGWCCSSRSILQPAVSTHPSLAVLREEPCLYLLSAERDISSKKR